jgi:hypothetical protein
MVRETSKGRFVASIGAIMASSPSRAAQPTGTVRTYEIQHYASGRWVVDSVADEKEVAITMAQSMMRGGRASHGVRVMSVQTKATGEYSEVTIYRRMPGDAEPTAPAPKAAPVPKADVKAAAEKRDFKHVDPPAKPTAPAKSRFGSVMLALKIALIVGLCAVAFEAFHILGR